MCPELPNGAAVEVSVLTDPDQWIKPAESSQTFATYHSGAANQHCSPEQHASGETPSRTKSGAE